MAWVATILNIEKKIGATAGGEGQPPPVTFIQYEITVKFFDKDLLSKQYTRRRTVSAEVTKAQVLTAIQNELADLNATDTFSSRVAPYMNTEIDETTVWT